MKAVRIAVVALAVSMVPAVSHAGVVVSITVAPPILPVYVQPICPEVGFLWTPGYWGYGPEGYFWVPGVWVAPPSPGLLWTPGYWGWVNGAYLWNGGYWGPHVGFYGGVNYGFGYGGVGFLGGRWAGGVFEYNTAVMHVGVGGGWHSYNAGVPVNNVHTAFNGGAGGIRASANADERRAMAEHHSGPTGMQNSHHDMASHDHGALASVNHGRPSNMAMSRAGSHAGGAAANHGGGPANHGGPASHGGGAPASHGGGAPASHGGGAPASHGGGAPASHGGGAPASHGGGAPASHGAPAGGGHAPSGGGSKGAPASHGGGASGGHPGKK